MEKKALVGGVGLLWLVLAYVLSAGPVRYTVARGWLPDSTFHTVYRPVWEVAIRSGLHNQWGSYHSWWHKLGWQNRTKISGTGGKGWEITVSSKLECSRSLLRTTNDDAMYLSEWEGHEIVVENGRRAPDGEIVAWDGPVLLDGRPVAVLPPGTRRLLIEYLDGELSVEADGQTIEVAD